MSNSNSNGSNSERKTRSDKGKTREHYNNTGREIAAADRQAQKMLKQFAETGELYIPEPGRPRSERRQEAREEKLPADRRCKFCKEIKLKSRAWVVGENAVGCKSCFMKHVFS